MAIQSKIVDMLPDNYGYVVLVGAGSIFLNLWMVFNVVRARKEYKIAVRITANLSLMTYSMLRHIHI